MYEKNKRNLWLAKNIAIQRILEDMDRATQHQQNEDTQRRGRINRTIRNGIIAGKSKEEIEEELLSNPEFEKYSIYFKNCINDQFKKSYRSCQKENSDNEQERD